MHTGPGSRLQDILRESISDGLSQGLTTSEYLSAMPGCPSNAAWTDTFNEAWTRRVTAASSLDTDTRRKRGRHHVRHRLLGRTRPINLTRRKDTAMKMKK